MKYQEYERPELEELDMIIEGSFLNDPTTNPGVDRDDEENKGEGDWG